jgi:eukaryotic-like serine/threonine-protein kinase
MNVDVDRVRSIFLEAIENHLPERWKAYLDQACVGHDRLRQRVEVLLRAHAETNSLLDQGLAAPSATNSELTSPEAPGIVIGPYKLLEQIGEGGFGVVFMAEQLQPVRRKVALKVIKPGMDTRQVIARFEAERQALALMDHPNIARVLEAAETLSGRPYFVMELVRGLSMTEYCDQHHLPVHDRLELFINVCQAVQHAHQKGIIHRDIKPSNVLVTLHDGKPVVKVIDFGIAKAMGQQLTDKTLFTNFAQMIGTPLYMSPEQAEMSGLDIDTRSDIYSLGVLLYELLTGTTPFDKERLKQAGFDEIRRIIREEEPPKPSTRMSTVDQAATTASENRQSDRRKLSRLFRGELDWIVMKCLEKDRNRRYESASSFARDVERYLHNEPVQACPPSTWYRAHKFARRQKAVLAVAASLFLAVAVIVIGLPVGVLLRGERNRAQAAEGEARAAQLDATAARHLAQARAYRYSGQVGQRFKALDELTAAALLGPTLELRNEAIACLALTDLRLGKAWNAAPAGTMIWQIDQQHKHYCRSDRQGNISVRRFDDDIEVWQLPGFGKHAYILKFSPDGKFLGAVHDIDWKVHVWDLTSGKHLWKQTCGEFTFSPDSRSLALRNHQKADSRLNVYEIATGKLNKSFPLASAGYGVAFDPSGTRLAAVRTTPPFGVQIFDVQTDQVTRISHSGHLCGLEWRPDGLYLASIDRPNDCVYVWNVMNGKQQAVLRGHIGQPLDITFSHDGELLASCGRDLTLRLWDSMTGQLLFTMENGWGWGSSPPQFRVDDHLVTALADAQPSVWELANGLAECRTLRSSSGGMDFVYALDFSPDGRLLVMSSGDGARLWDWAARREIAFLPESGMNIAVFNPADGSLLTCGSKGLHRWPILADSASTNGNLLVGPAQLIGEPRNVSFASPNRDRKTVAVVVDRESAFLLSFDGKSKPVFITKQPFLHKMILSPDGRWAATGVLKTDQETATKVWDARTGELVREFTAEEVNGDATVNFSGDGRWLATNNDREYRLWEVGSWKPGIIVPKRQRFNTAVAFTRDGTVMAVADTAQRVVLLNPNTGEELASLPVPRDWPILALCFSPDGSQLACGANNRMTQVWDLRYIRQELAKIGLDWDSPVLPFASNTAGHAKAN